MSRASVLDRLEKLFAMAGSPVVEEARTAALMAVKLMKKHGIVPRFPESEPERVHTPTPPAPPPPQQPWSGQYQDRSQYQPPRAYHPPGFDKYKSMPAMRSAACKACGQLYNAGETVLVGVSRHGITHERCSAYWNE